MLGNLVNYVLTFGMMFLIAAVVALPLAYLVFMFIRRKAQKRLPDKLKKEVEDDRRTKQTERDRWKIYYGTNGEPPKGERPSPGRTGPSEPKKEVMPERGIQLPSSSKPIDNEEAPGRDKERIKLHKPTAF
jgi:hypothetical protein